VRKGNQVIRAIDVIIQVENLIVANTVIGQPFVLTQVESLVKTEIEPHQLLQKADLVRTIPATRFQHLIQGFHPGRDIGYGATVVCTQYQPCSLGRINRPFALLFQLLAGPVPGGITLE
jgi:hypothetical protein